MIQHQIITGNQQEWIAKLLGLDFEVVYKVEVENTVVGALSRQDEDMEVRTMLSYPIWQHRSRLQQVVLKDPAKAVYEISVV